MFKKSLAVLMVGLLSTALSFSAFAHGENQQGEKEDSPGRNRELPAAITLNYNGVNVKDADAYYNNNVPYVSVEVFANHYSVKTDYDRSKKRLTLNGKAVNNEYGEPKQVRDALTAPIQAMAEALGDADAKKQGHYAIGIDNAKKNVNVAILPKGVVALEDGFVVPNMGSHWADPTKLPLGPIFGIYKGKLIFFEYMPDKELNRDVTLDGSGGVPLPPFVDHAGINWNPNGHPGDPVPHYDVHMYFISTQEQSEIK